MAKAFECDGCGTLMKHPVKASGSIKINGKVFHMHLVFTNGEKHAGKGDREHPDLCLKCAGAAVQNIALLDYQEESNVITR